MSHAALSQADDDLAVASLILEEATLRESLEGEEIEAYRQFDSVVWFSLWEQRERSLIGEAENYERHAITSVKYAVQAQWSSNSTQIHLQRLTEKQVSQIEKFEARERKLVVEFYADILKHFKDMQNAVNIQQTSSMEGIVQWCEQLDKYTRESLEEFESDTRDQLQSLHNDMADAYVYVEKLTAESSKILAQVDQTMAQRLTDLQKRVNQMEHILPQLGSSSSTQKELAREISFQNKTMKAAVQKRLEDVEDAEEWARSSLQTEWRQFNSTIAQYQTALTDMNWLIGSLNAQVAESRTSKKSVESRVIKEKEQLEKDLDDEKAEKVSVEQRLAEVSADRAKLDRQLQQLQLERDSFEDSLRALQQDKTHQTQLTHSIRRLFDWSLDEMQWSEQQQRRSITNEFQSGFTTLIERSDAQLANSQLVGHRAQLSALTTERDKNDTKKHQLVVNQLYSFTSSALAQVEIEENKQRSSIGWDWRTYWDFLRNWQDDVTQIESRSSQLHAQLDDARAARLHSEKKVTNMIVAQQDDKSAAERTCQQLEGKIAELDSKLRSYHTEHEDKEKQMETEDIERHRRLTVLNRHLHNVWIDVITATEADEDRERAWIISEWRKQCVILHDYLLAEVQTTACITENTKLLHQLNDEEHYRKQLEVKLSAEIQTSARLEQKFQEVQILMQQFVNNGQHDVRMLEETVTHENAAARQLALELENARHLEVRLAEEIALHSAEKSELINQHAFETKDLRDQVRQWRERNQVDLRELRTELEGKLGLEVTKSRDYERRLALAEEQNKALDRSLQETRETQRYERERWDGQQNRVLGQREDMVRDIESKMQDTLLMCQELERKLSSETGKLDTLMAEKEELKVKNDILERDHLRESKVYKKQLHHQYSKLLETVEDDESRYRTWVWSTFRSMYNVFTQWHTHMGDMHHDSMRLRTVCEAHKEEKERAERAVDTLLTSKGITPPHTHPHTHPHSHPHPPGWDNRQSDPSFMFPGELHLDSAITALEEERMARKEMEEQLQRVLQSHNQERDRYERSVAEFKEAKHMAEERAAMALSQWQEERLQMQSVLHDKDLQRSRERKYAYSQESQSIMDHLWQVERDETWNREQYKSEWRMTCTAFVGWWNVMNDMLFTLKQQELINKGNATSMMGHRSSSLPLPGGASPHGGGGHHHGHHNFDDAYYGTYPQHTNNNPPRQSTFAIMNLRNNLLQVETEEAFHRDMVEQLWVDRDHQHQWFRGILNKTHHTSRVLHKQVYEALLQQVKDTVQIATLGVQLEEAQRRHSLSNEWDVMQNVLLEWWISMFKLTCGGIPQLPLHIPSKAYPHMTARSASPIRAISPGQHARNGGNSPVFTTQTTTTRRLVPNRLPPGRPDMMTGSPPRHHISPFRLHSPL